MDRRPLGNTGLNVTPIGFGAFKIGRNEGIKYPRKYELPSDKDADKILHAMLDLGIGYIDTAPAYGESERRIGDALHARRHEFTLSTKVGETFDAGVSRYDFATPAVTQSLERSLRRLRTDHVDLLLIHSNGDDERILRETDIVATMQRFRGRGLARAIGFSGKTNAGLRLALDWADAIMVEYHAEHVEHLAVMRDARTRGVGVIVKKGLASGRHAPGEALRFAFASGCTDSVVVGSLNVEHMRANLAALRA